MTTVKAVKERPIIFRAEMVRAILDGSKTQTRRIAKLPPAPMHLGEWEPSIMGGKGVFYSDGQPAEEQVCIWHTRTGKCIACPYGVIGDRLWVRETWTGAYMQAPSESNFGTGDCDPIYPGAGQIPKSRPYYFSVDYRADCPPGDTSDGWFPSIHMPRWASRINLEIVNIRVERVQDISESDAVAEGVEPMVSDCCSGLIPFRNYLYIGNHLVLTARESYQTLWESLHGTGSWYSNPFVWVIEFRRLETK